jgi:hypothetical protein
MNVITPRPGARLYNVLEHAVKLAPAEFTFNTWKFQTIEGETFGDARQRFQAIHGVEVLSLQEQSAFLRARNSHNQLLEACQAALEHVTELRDAWMRGSLTECDGKGGTRSNRNVTVELELRAAIAAATGE